MVIIAMTHRIIRFEYNYEFESRCDQCGGISYGYYICVYRYPRYDWCGVYCDKCIKGIDVVYDYWLEYNDTEVDKRYIFYDLETALKDHRFTPVLMKI